MGFKAVLATVVVGLAVVSGGEADSAEPPCPSGMMEVSGSFCPQVEQVCLRWFDPDNKGPNGPVQCAEFAEPRCLSAPSNMQPKHFCIDKYEYPNKPGEMPRVQASWLEMKATCEAEGKRLCTDSEFTFACEGPKMKPYPYGDGLHRNYALCNIDRPAIDPFVYRTHVRPDGVREKKTVGERPLSEVDQRTAIGSHPWCASDFGVVDMVGNADEWVVNETGRPYVSGLKGGHWVTGARNRCRPMTEVHNPPFKMYVTGGRCCSDPQR